jgi:mannosyltransferase
MDKPMTEIRAITPNLKRRLSGVTSTVLRLVPLQSGVVATGPGLPAHIPHIPLWRAALMPRDRWRVWHARRNTEMLLGIVLRYVLRRRYKLLFTSAAQRHHSGYTRWLIRQMDHVIATSERSASFLEVPATVIRHGIDASDFHPATDRASLAHKLGLPTGLYVGAFGRVRPSKGTDIIIDAMCELMPKHPDLRCLIVGRTTQEHTGYRQTLIKRLTDLGLAERVVFTGELPWNTVKEYMQLCQILLAFSRAEGFGLTPLEAMASGAAVIASQAGAFQEIVAEGITGHTRPATDTDGLTRALDSLLSDDTKRAAFGAAGRERVLAEFTLHAEAQAINHVYARLLNA